MFLSTQRLDRDPRAWSQRASHLIWLIERKARSDARSFYEKSQAKAAAVAYLIRGRGRTVASAGRTLTASTVPGFFRLGCSSYVTGWPC